MALSAGTGTSVSQRFVSMGVRCIGYWSRPMTTYGLMESLTRLCWRLFHSTAKAYWPLSLRGRRLGVRFVMEVVAQPTSNQGSSSSGSNLFKFSITGRALHERRRLVKLDLGRRMMNHAQPGLEQPAQASGPED